MAQSPVCPRCAPLWRPASPRPPASAPRLARRFPRVSAPFCQAGPNCLAEPFAACSRVPNVHGLIPETSVHVRQNQPGAVYCFGLGIRVRVHFVSVCSCCSLLFLLFLLFLLVHFLSCSLHYFTCSLHFFSLHPLTSSACLPACASFCACCCCSLCYLARLLTCLLTATPAPLRLLLLSPPSALARLRVSPLPCSFLAPLPRIFAAGSPKKNL